MRRLFEILATVLVIMALPSMLGAVVVPDADVSTADSSMNMPNSHGPVMGLPSGPLLLSPNPAVLGQSDEILDENDEDKSDENQANEAAVDIKESEDTATETDEPSRDASEVDDEKELPALSQEPEETLEPLTPEMESLRSAVRKTLNSYRSQPLNTRDNTAAHILQACLAYGCDTTVREGGSSGNPINGITCLCWNYPCGGYNLLKMSGDHIAARIGYGLQANPSQFLAVLALARVPEDYPVRVDETVRTVADLVESEKLSCRSGSDLSFKLIALSRYLPQNATWKNDLGETWSIARIIKQELDNVQKPAPNGGTHRLLALAYAVDRRADQKQPIDGQFLRAKKYLDRYQEYALSLQNQDGTWHPQFFKARGQSRSTIGQVNSTGHILAWLVVSMSDEDLKDARVVRSVARLSNLLTGNRHNSLTKTSSRDIAARMHALYALSVYDTRVFKPHDKVEEPEEAEQPAAEEKVAERETNRH